MVLVEVQIGSPEEISCRHAFAVQEDKFGTRQMLDDRLATNILAAISSTDAVRQESVHFLASFFVLSEPMTCAKVTKKKQTFKSYKNKRSLPSSALG